MGGLFDSGGRARGAGTFLAPKVEETGSSGTPRSNSTLPLVSCYWKLETGTANSIY